MYLGVADYQLTVFLRDPSLPGGPSPTELKIKFFKKKLGDLPPIGGSGDVVILRRMKQLVRFNDKVFVDNYNTVVFVFKASSIPDTVLAKDLNALDKEIAAIEYATNKPNAKLSPLTTDERRYAVFLWKWIAEESGTAGVQRKRASNEPINPASIIASASDRKQALLSGVEPFKFYNLTVEIIRTHKTAEKTTIYVTDYTSNSLFYEYSNNDEHSDINPAYASDLTTGKRIWKGPTGKMALQITLWPPHSDFTNENVQEGNIVNIRNVNIMHNKNAMNIIEGKVHTDRHSEQRVNIALANEKSVQYQELIARKDTYWKKHLNSAVQLQDGNQAGMSKQAKKKAKQKKRQQEKRELQEREKNMDPFISSKTSSLNPNSKSLR
jgi:hypothetical protein